MDEIKRIVAYAAADAEVHSGSTIGLGTGSTAIHVVRRVAERLERGELREIVAVATGIETATEAERLGIPVVGLGHPRVRGHLAVVIDGADEIDPHRNLIKGGGAAHLREKIVAAAGARLVIVADESKRVARLGERMPIPLEVFPAALALVERRAEALGFVPNVRMATRKAGPVITDQGNLVVDLTAPEPFDAAAAERDLQMIPGVFAVGLFVGFDPAVYVGRADGAVEVTGPAAGA